MKIVNAELAYAVRHLRDLVDGTDGSVMLEAFKDGSAELWIADGQGGIECVRLAVLDSGQVVELQRKRVNARKVRP